MWKKKITAVLGAAFFAGSLAFSPTASATMISVGMDDLPGATAEADAAAKKRPVENKADQAQKPAVKKNESSVGMTSANNDYEKKFEKVGKTSSGKSGNAEKEKEKKKKTEPYRLKVYDLEGRELLDRGVSLGAEGLSIDGDKVFLYHDTALLIYDIHGRLRFRGELDLPIESVRATSSFGPFGGSILVGSDGILKSVRLR